MLTNRLSGFIASRAVQPSLTGKQKHHKQDSNNSYAAVTTLYVHGTKINTCVARQLLIIIITACYDMHVDDLVTTAWQN